MTCDQFTFLHLAVADWMAVALLGIAVCVFVSEWVSWDPLDELDIEGDENEQGNR